MANNTFTTKMTKLKKDKFNNPIGQGAIFDDPHLDCQFIIISTSTGNLQRLFSRFSKSLTMDTTKCKMVKVIPHFK
jgi:hypothetical protein